MSGDKKQLKRALYNWLDNAIRHSGAGQYVQLSLKSDAGSVRAEVRDQGEGIPQENLPHIWDRIFRQGETGQWRHRPGPRHHKGDFEAP